MTPAFLPGDHLLLGPPWRVRPGSVVAVTDPRRPDRLMVKRVAAVDGKSVVVLGDNASASTDSRHFGPVDRRALVGRVLLRYAPADRTAWWPQ